jgi:toxin-antitoxin system PIN domain toxin
MRFLIDTNILLHSVNSRSEHHARARGFLEQHLAEGTPWCLSWGIIYEFLRVATHARVFPRALSAQQACGYLGVLLERQEVSVLVPTQRHWQLLQKTLNELAHPAGNLFHDVSTAVLMREHGVQEIVTADSDFLQFPFLRVVNPLL